MSLTTIALGVQGLMIVNAIFFLTRAKYHADKCIKYQAQMIEALLTDLCCRTQGDEREKYRQQREVVQSMLEQMK